MNKYTISFLDTKTPSVVIECDKVAEMNGNLYCYIGTTTVAIFHDWKSVVEDRVVVPLKKVEPDKPTPKDVPDACKINMCLLCYGTGIMSNGSSFARLCPNCQPRTSL